MKLPRTSERLRLYLFQPFQNHLLQTAKWPAIIMCGVEIISLKSANCAWVQTTDHHIWQMFTYHLCPTGAVRHCPCDNVQPVGGQTENDIGSLRMTACPVCTKLDAAERACVEAKRLADEEYARAWTAAQKEERHVSL